MRRMRQMNGHHFNFCNVAVEACPSGVLWLPETQTVCVSDLHLGKADRLARRGATLLPPYETQDTLARLASEVNRLNPRCVVCLGDSFDDLMAADALQDSDHAKLSTMQAGREWVWIEGNHDPGPVNVGGTHRTEYAQNGLTFRHIATAAPAEISGHFHPKHAVKGAGAARACFIYDRERLMMPAFGTFTGGLRCTDPAIRSLFGKAAVAVLTGRRAVPVPLK